MTLLGRATRLALPHISSLCGQTLLGQVVSKTAHLRFFYVLTFFTARGYAKRGICRRRVSVCVCVSVCLSVTLRYCIKTAIRRITQTTPHDSPMILVF